MTTDPTPEQTAFAHQLLTVAASAIDGSPTPAIDWLDDRDVVLMFLVSASLALVEGLGTRDDLGDGLMSGRLALVLDSNGARLAERTGNA